MQQTETKNTNAEESNSNSQLLRTIGLITAILLVFSQMIGSGVFKKVAAMSLVLPSSNYIILAWVLAGGISLIGALTNAEVAGLIADPGGQYAYFRKMYGRFFAFLFGWASFFVIQSATTASVAYVFAESFNALFPLPHWLEDYASISILGISPFQNFSVKAITILLIAALTYLNYRGVKYGSRVSDILASIITVSIIAIIFSCFKDGISFLGQEAKPIQPTIASKLSSNGTDVNIISALFTAMISAFWAYEGWNNMGYLGGEVKNPKRNIPYAFVFGVGGVMLLYTTVNIAYLNILPIETFREIANTPNSIAAVEVMKAIWGQGGVIFVSVLILVSTFNSTNGSIMTSCRLYYAMALDRMFFKPLAYCHPTYRTPSNSMIAQAFWASVLVISGSFDTLTDLLVFAAFLFYGAMAMGVFILRFKMRDSERSYKAIGYPILPAIFILFCVVLVINTLISEPVQSMVGLGLIASGIPFYLYWQSQRGKNSLDEDEAKDTQPIIPL